VSKVHRIRLTTGWIAHQNASAGATLSRSFQKPSGLRPGQAVFLCLRGSNPNGITVNSQSLPFSSAEGLACVNITDMMQQKNRVELRWTVGSDEIPSFAPYIPDEQFEAWLEISEDGD
jgi:hypothetical protein